MTVGRSLVHAVFVIVTAASRLKFADLAEFSRSLKSWTLLPDWWLLPLTYLVPGIELALGAAWFIGHAKALVVRLLIIVLSIFTAGYGSHWLLVSPPTCRCFGAISAHANMIESSWMLMGRNAVMIAILVLCANGTRNQHRTRAHRADTATRAPGSRLRRGFTVVELLIVIATIAVVVSLLLPAMAHLRAEAQDIKSLVHLRSHGQAVFAYTADFADVHPFLTEPQATHTVLRGGGQVVSVPFFFLFASWNVGLADSYYNGVAVGDAWTVPWLTQPEPYTHYFYSDCFISRPEYWNYYTRLADRSQLRPTNAAEVLFPSAKGLIYELGWVTAPDSSRGPGSPTRMAMADGAAREYLQSELLPVYAQGSWAGGTPGLQMTFGLPGMATIDGVRGRDVP